MIGEWHSSGGISGGSGRGKRCSGGTRGMEIWCSSDSSSGREIGCSS